MPKLIDNDLAPTVLLGEERDGPVKVCAVARELTVSCEFIAEAAEFPLAENVAIVLSDVVP